MTVGEANAANVLIKAAIYPGTITDEQLLEQANLLARSAHKRLGAGWSGAGDIERALSDRSEGTTDHTLTHRCHDGRRYTPGAVSWPCPAGR